MMLFVLCVTAGFFGCPQGEAYVLQPSHRGTAGTATSISDMPVVKVNRCQGESLQSIRQKLLKALNLDQEPRVSSTGLSKLKDGLKVAMVAASQSSMKSQSVTEVNATSMLDGAENRDAANSTDLRCCQLVSQIFITDLGWENWVLYPDSFTYTHCTVCHAHLDQTAPRCRALGPGRESTSECCQPISQELVPFIYRDELNTLVISSVRLTRECGCKPTPDHQPLQN